MDLKCLRQHVLTPSGPPAAAPDAASFQPGAIDRSLGSARPVFVLGGSSAAEQSVVR